MNNLREISFNIKKLSSYLFWDVDPVKLDAEKNKKLIIGRVLDYGLLADWQYIKYYYGIEKISEVATTIRDLDPKSMAYISVLSNIPEEKFTCYISTQSHPRHWNF
jgi:hypothetical protein